MYGSEKVKAVNAEAEAVLQEVQDLINLVDVLARATGNFLNSSGGGETDGGKCFSDGVSNWLFDKSTSYTALRRRERALRAAQIEREQYVAGCDGDNQPTSVHISQPEFSSLGSSVDGQNLASSYYSRQLVSHHVSSYTDFKAPVRSRYLDNQAQAVQLMRQRLAAFDRPLSACELVGPITSTSSPEKAVTPGKTVTLSGGGYSNVKNFVAKSKSLFEDFAGPNNPNYKPPWENKPGYKNRHTVRY